ncbi:hypothetical protein B0H14DRAFT_2584040 [Mycena olivaceomarginata]|nr:hypothetical protein B0H14DRAFT_2584040 [Mycena olivaceomarginata]
MAIVQKQGDNRIRTCEAQQPIRRSDDIDPSSHSLFAVHQAGLIEFKPVLNTDQLQWMLIQFKPSHSGVHLNNVPGSIEKERSDGYIASELPSQVTIYQHMLAQDEQFEGSMVPRNRVARFLNEALMIQEDHLILRRKLVRALDGAHEQGLQLLGSEIMPRSPRGDATRTARDNANNRRQSCIAERNISTVPGGERKALSSIRSNSCRAPHRRSEVAGGSGLRRLACGIRTVVKAIRALRDRKEKNERQQKQNSRAGDHINDAVRRREFCMKTYDAARQAMISLDSMSQGPDSAFPPLSVDDTFMKSVVKKRQLGDSRFTDGQLFTVGSDATQPSIQPIGVSPALETGGPSTDAGPSTQMSKRKSADVALKAQLDESISHPRAPKKRLKKRKNGKRGGYDGTLEQWWFRAEAEVQCWQEHVEMRLAELLRTIRSFHKWDGVWMQLANTPKFGYSAYAKQKAHMYRVRGEQCEKLIRDSGYGTLLEPGTNLVEFVVTEPAREPLY